LPAIVGTPRETFPGERRVAITPRHVEALKKVGIEVLVEHHAGMASGYTDEAYVARGAQMVDRQTLFASATLIAQVRSLGANPDAGRADLALLRNGQAVVGFGEPLTAGKEALDLATSGVSFLAMELMPRITRAQSMDALSSMGTICGYKAVLIAADTLPRIFPMLTTAAGTITPGRVFIIGAGVTGLQAIATARRLGAVTSAYDMRPAAKEQVHSLGARFVELPIEATDAQDAGGYARAQGEDFYRRQRELLARVVAESDVVITAAVIPGQKSPVLVTGEMVARMAPGSVIVDLASERGGNCELTKTGEVVIEHGVSIIGWINIAGRVPYHASQLYGRNLSAFLLHLVQDGKPRLNLEDEIIHSTLVTREGQIVNPRVREFYALPALTVKQGGQ
jgi:H+-translocating NAD(P) transhydrogenase subunit alpha